MSFAARNLSVLAYAQGFTLWHYAATADSLDTVGTDGFFNDAADMLTGGDMVLISASDGGRAAFLASSSGTLTTVPAA